MEEKYYKIRKEIALRAGLDERMREVVEEDFLLLSEKDIKMISLTFDEKLHAIDACEVCEHDNISTDIVISEDNVEPEIIE